MQDIYVDIAKDPEVRFQIKKKIPLLKGQIK